MHGEAGIGKTTLLETLVERCADAVTVARACGAETEAERAFSALTELLYPVLRQLDALPAPQAAALMSALALKAPAPGDRLAVCVAALGGDLRRRAARPSPATPWPAASLAGPARRGRAPAGRPGRPRRVPSRWPVLAAEMLADAANGATTINSYLEAEQLAQRAVSLLGDAGDPAVRAAVLTMRGWTLLLRGKAPQARPVLAEAFRLADGLDKLGPDWPWLHILLRTRIPLGEFEQARAENAELCRRAQEAGALATVSAAGLLVADAAFRLGDWEAADAAAQQTFQLAGEVGHRHMAGWALTIRTRILAAQGRSEESRAIKSRAIR